MSLKEQFQRFFDRLLMARSLSEAEEAQAEFYAFLDALTPEQKKAHSTEMLDFAEQKVDFIGEGIAILQQQAEVRYGGQTYSLNDWLTPERYRKAYGVEDEQALTDWIVQGLIPQEDIVSIPELNHLKLIRNRKYPIDQVA